ncbi:MAG: MATE family efflux transporter [candidate division Zixibacteria bacterium]|nr:MATE family efflux transporter [candidate division Zixibacteria bacterium]
MTDHVDHPAPDHRHILRDIWAMGYPSMIGFAATNLYTLADMFWVSRLGADRVAALAIFNAFYWVISSVNMIAGGGSVAIISRRFGENDRPRTETAIVEAFALKFALAAVCGIIGYFLTPTIVELLGARDVVIDYAVSYGQVMFLALVVNFPCWTLYTALRGIKQPRTAMVIMLSSTAFNAILDPFMIFGWWIFPELGIAGAAWASAISFCLTVTLGLVLFFAGAFDYKLTALSVRRMHISTMMQMLRIGLPTGINALAFSLARTVVMPMIAHFGAPVVAIYGMGNRVVELGEVMVVGLELGVSPLVGHALGARDKARAWLTAKLAVRVGVGLMAVFGIICAVFARQITGLFFEGEPYLSLGQTFFHITAVFFPFLGMLIVLEGAFNGAGDTVPPMIVGLIHAWIFQIPAVYLLTYVFDLGPSGVWWGMVVAMVLGSLIFLWWFYKKRWLDRAV